MAERDCDWCEGCGYVDRRHCGFDDCIHGDENERCRKCGGTGSLAQPAAREGGDK